MHRLWSSFYLDYVGINFVTYSLFIACLFILNALLEVPLGAVSDFIGRRKALLLGNLFVGFGLLSIVLFPGKEVLYSASVFISSGGTLASGNLNSIGYEAFRDDEMEKEEFSRFLAKISTLSISAMDVAALLGGIVASINIALPMFIDIFLIMIKTCIGFFFFAVLWPDEEKKIQKPEKLLLSRVELNEVIGILKTGSFAVAMLLGVTTFVLLRTSLNFYQPMLSLKGISETQLGILFCTGILASAMISRVLLKHLQVDLNLRAAILIFLGLTSASGIFFWLDIGNSSLIVAGFFLHQLLRIFVPAVTMSEMHRAIPDGHARRTTIISVTFFIQAIVAALVVAATGFLADHVFSYNLTMGALHLSTLILIGIIAVLGSTSRPANA